MREAACKGMSLDLFFGPEAGSKGGGRATELALKKGKQVCTKCHRRSECYDEAKSLEWGAWGVWGGVMWRDGVPDE